MSDTIIVTFHQLNAQVLSLSQGSEKPKNIRLNWLDLFENLVEWGYEGFQYPYSSNRFCGLIYNITVDRPSNRIDLVFVVADVDADAQCARNLHDNTTRMLTRNVGEAADKRAHVVFKVDPTQPCIANIAMEHERGVTTRTLVNTLNYFFRHARLENTHDTAQAFFVGEHPTERYVRGDQAGKPKPLEFKINIEYQSSLSEEIIEAFKTGKIKNVEYFRPPTTINGTLDDHDFFRQDSLTVHLKVNAITIPTNLQGKNEWLQWAKNPFKELIYNNPDLSKTLFTIRFSDPSGGLRSATYDPQTDEFSLVKKTHLSSSLRQPMTANIQLNTALCDRMFTKI